MKNLSKISFLIDGVQFSRLPHTGDKVTSGDSIKTVYSFESGLKVTNILREYPEYDAYDWVNIWENHGEQPTGIISDLWDCSVEIPFAKGDRISGEDL